MRLVDIAVFLTAGTAPPLLIWLFGTLGGRGTTIHPSVFVVSGLFGFGVAVIARTKGWA